MSLTLEAMTKRKEENDDDGYDDYGDDDEKQLLISRYYSPPSSTLFTAGGRGSSIFGYWAKNIVGMGRKRRMMIIRRRKLPWVRLGGKRRRQRRRKKGIMKYSSSLLSAMRSVFRVRRMIKVRLLRPKYKQKLLMMLKKLKSFYTKLMKDLIEAGATLDVIQKRVTFDSYMGLPVWAMSVATTIPSHLDHHLVPTTTSVTTTTPKVGHQYS